MLFCERIEDVNISSNWLVQISISISIFGDDCEEIVADAGNNADLYAANQGSTELINAVYTEEAPLRFMGQDVFHHQPLSLD